MPTNEGVEALRKLLSAAVPDPDDVAAVVDEIKPLLAGHPPALQGAVLADLVAIWLVGHHPEIRKIMYDMHVDIVPRLVSINHQIIYGDEGFPGADDV